MSKKRIGFVTSSILLKTGFSTNARALLPYLWSKQEYEIFHLNQGMGDTPEFERLPWKNDAVMKPGIFDQHRFGSDHGYQRTVSYGNLAVEKFIIDNRLDYLVLAEDPWSYEPDYYFKSRWWPSMKNNVLLWTTVDSLPILPLVKEWSENSNNVWFWASFGVRALQNENKEKFKHLKCVFGCLDAKEWKLTTQKERNELRLKNNIDTNTILFLQIGRNQLRKIFPATIESFAKFKKQYPEHKAKLHFHCSYSEATGWPLQRLTTELGLKNEDVLVTYFCRACSEWEIKPFVGEDQNCRFCGVEKGQITAGVTSGISNQELARIMQLSDASISCFTSGGMEYANVQSLLCGLPLLCTEYSSGEDFVDQEFVSRLDGSFTFEVGTGFKKHVPNQNTIIKFFKKICELPIEKRKEVGQKGRDWALKTFDVSIIGKQVEDWINNTPKHNWNFELPKVELKDPNAIIENSSDDAVWIKEMYKKILKMDVADNDSGLNYWLGSLKNGMPRNQIESYFRNVATEENRKNNSKQENPFESLLENTGRKRFLIVAKESIGDLLYLSALLLSFKKSYPDYDLYLACDPNYAEVFDGNKNLFKVIPYYPFMESEIACTGQGENKGWFDGYCHLTVSTQRHLNYLTNNNTNIKLHYE